MEKRIYLSPPNAGSKEFNYLKDAFDSNWIAPVGPYLKKFEDKICELTSCSHAVAVASGTAAVHLALELCGVGKGDLVLCQSLTFIATVSPAIRLGATPIFIDSEDSSWNMDPQLLAEEVSRLIKNGTPPKAVIVVNIYGQSADLDPIKNICTRHNIALIEDAAESLGATYKGKASGSIGDLGVFSFNGNKTVTTSGGGMLVGKNKITIDKAKFLSTQAKENVPYYEHKELGYNYRLSNLLAAIGCAQLESLGKMIARRKRNFELYRAAFKDLPGITMMPIADYGEPNYWLSCITVDPKEFGVDYETIRLELEKNNVESRPLWKPMHLQPVFKECRIVGGSVSAKLFATGLCLPSGSNLTDEELEYVISIIRALKT